MIRLRNRLLLLSAVVGAALLGAPTQARAAYSVNVYDDGVLQGGIGVLVVGNSLIFGGSTTHFSITNGSGSSNNPGVPATSNLALSTNQQVTALFGTTGGTHTIRIELSQTGFTSPPSSPLMLSSSAGGSTGYVMGIDSSATQTVTATYQGFLDNTNTLFGQPGAGSTTLQTATTSGTNLTNPLVFSPGTSVNLVPGGTPFAITDVLEFTFTLGAGSGQTTANVSTNTVAAPVPAPAGLVLALTGIPCMGLANWLRRRRQAA